MRKIYGRLSVCVLTLACGLSLVTADANANPKIGGFAGHPAPGSTASCFTEANGGVEQSGCSGITAFEIALDVDWDNTTTVGATMTLANGNAAASMYCYLTSMADTQTSYYQQSVRYYPNTAAGEISFTNITTNLGTNYIACSMPVDSQILGVYYKNSY